MIEDTLTTNDVLSAISGQLISKAGLNGVEAEIAARRWLRIALREAWDQGARAQAFYSGVRYVHAVNPYEKDAK